MIARFLALLATSAALVTSAVAGSAPARADAIGLCSATHGTIVAVDFSHWGGPIVRGCGVDSKTGYDLLHDGGFTTTGDQHDGPAFICRLGNGAFRGGTQYPTPEQDACVVTPPASAYWSYWVAPRGQHTWSYSQNGAMRDVPKDGEVELWQFGATNVSGTQGGPSVSPDSLRAQNSAPALTSNSVRPSTPTRNHRTSAGHPTSAAARSSSAVRHATSTTPGSSGSTSRNTTGASGSAAHSSSSSKHTTSAAGSSSRVASSGGSPAEPASGQGSGGSAAPAIVDASPASKSTASPAGDGSPAALIVGGGLVIVLAAGAGWTIMRRRRTDPDV